MIKNNLFELKRIHPCERLGFNGKMCIHIIRGSEFLSECQKKLFYKILMFVYNKNYKKQIKLVII